MEISYFVITAALVGLYAGSDGLMLSVFFKEGRVPSPFPMLPFLTIVEMFAYYFSNYLGSSWVLMAKACLLGFAISAAYYVLFRVPLYRLLRKKCKSGKR